MVYARVLEDQGNPQRRTDGTGSYPSFISIILFRIPASMNIYQAISAVMAEVGPISKDRKNTQQNYGFRGIDDMYNALNPILPKYGIFFVPNVLSEKREERATKSGGVLIHTILMVEYTVYATDGSSVKLVTVGEAMDSGDKSANKAMSVALKYAVMQLFCIPTEDEKDTEAQTHEVAPRQTAPNASQSTQAPKAVQVGQYGTCKDCGANKVLNPNTGKTFCERKCWLQPKDEVPTIDVPTDEIPLDGIPF